MLAARSVATPWHLGCILDTCIALHALKHEWGSLWMYVQRYSFPTSNKSRGCICLSWLRDAAWYSYNMHL